MATYSALYIPADIFADIETVELERGLQPIYSKLGINYLEPVPTGNPDIEIIADEEAILIESPINHRATYIRIQQHILAGIPLRLNDTLQVLGDVLITGGVDENGNTKSLSQKDEEYIRQAINDITKDSEE